MTTFWTRSELKERAKVHLRNFYWQAFAVCLIAVLLGAGIETVDLGKRRNTWREGNGIFVETIPGVEFSYGAEGRFRVSTPVYNKSFPLKFSFAVMTVILALMILALTGGILISNVVQVGKRRYFLKKTAEIQGTGVGELFSGFSEGYGNLVAVMFQRNLYIFLWSLLLVIPGLIKSYEYYMVPYLLAEDPGLSWEKARDLSYDMMEGNKMRVFVLELSFIGWDIAGSLLCGVGQVFVLPYKEVVYAELYHTLRRGSDSAAA